MFELEINKIVNFNKIVNNSSIIMKHKWCGFHNQCHVQTWTSLVTSLVSSNRGVVKLSTYTIYDMLCGLLFEFTQFYILLILV